MNEKETRICLGMVVLLNGRFSIEVKKSNKSDFGFTIDPKVFITSSNDERMVKYVRGLLRYFRMGWTPQKRQRLTIVNRYHDLMVLLEELVKASIENRGLFPPHFNKMVEQFSAIMELYAEKRHYKKEGFFEILDMRESFMPNAMSRQVWVEKNFGVAQNV